MLKITAAAILLSVATPALAVQAFGSISFAGSDTYDATRINFTGPASIIGTSTGSFALLGNCLGCVTMTSFNYAAFTPVTLLSATNNGSTLTFRLESLTEVSRNQFGSLSIDGLGTVTQTGFESNTGRISLTSQGGGDGIRNVSFSSTLQAAATTVPEPATWGMLILGFGLVGASMRRRRVVSLFRAS